MGVIRDPARNTPMISIERGTRYAAFKTGIDEANYGGVRDTVAMAR